MELNLVYQGPLPSGRSAEREEKQRIRKALHPQLRDLWGRPPLVRLLNFEQPGQPPRDPSLLKTVAGIRFLPVVSDRLRLVAHLDITLLRPEWPGSLITSGGDLDNRLECPRIRRFPRAWPNGLPTSCSTACLRTTR